MYKNLSKSRFILILCVAIFLLIVLISQFIFLAVLRNKNQSLNDELALKETEQSISEKNLENVKNNPNDLHSDGYVYDGEEITVEE